MMVSKVNRRQFLKVSGIGTGLLLGSSFDVNAQSNDKIKVIQIRSNYRIGRWYFDPVGLHIQPGEKVRLQAVVFTLAGWTVFASALA